MVDNCQVCKGAMGGTPGNENRVGATQERAFYVVMCDYCDVLHKERKLTWQDVVNTAQTITERMNGDKIPICTDLIKDRDRSQPATNFVSWVNQLIEDSLYYENEHLIRDRKGKSTDE